MLYPTMNDIRKKFDLSGIWDFKIDPEEAGEKEGWFNGLEDALPIAVPGSWNEQYKDLYNYFELAWYVKRSYIPADWKNECVFLRVGSACYRGTVYVNGVKLGSHEGNHLPFAFEINEHVRWGEENTIAISVENQMKPTRVPSGNMGSSMGMFTTTPRTTFDYFPFAGIHRPVVLYSAPRTHIEDITVVTEIRGNTGIVKVSAQLNAPASLTGSLQLKGGSTAVSADMVFRLGKAEGELEVPAARVGGINRKGIFTRARQKWPRMCCANFGAGNDGEICRLHLLETAADYIIIVKTHIQT